MNAQTPVARASEAYNDLFGVIEEVVLKADGSLASQKQQQQRTRGGDS